QHFRNTATLDDETRLIRFDGNPVVHRRRFALALLLGDVNDLADDAAGSDDFIASLEIAQSLLMILSLLLLRPNHHEVEDREDRDDLEREGKQRRAPTGGGLEEKGGRQSRSHC